MLFGLIELAVMGILTGVDRYEESRALLVLCLNWLMPEHGDGVLVWLCSKHCSYTSVGWHRATCCSQAVVVVAMER